EPAAVRHGLPGGAGSSGVRGLERAHVPVAQPTRRHVHAPRKRCDDHDGIEGVPLRGGGRSRPSHPTPPPLTDEGPNSPVPDLNRGIAPYTASGSNIIGARRRCTSSRSVRQTSGSMGALFRLACLITTRERTSRSSWILS